MYPVICVGIEIPVISRITCEKFNCFMKIAAIEPAR